MASLQESAEAYVQKYAAEISTGKELMEATSEEDQQARVDGFCKKMTSFFLPKPVLFGMPGPPQQWASHEAGQQMLKTVIGRYIDFGIGFQGALKSSKVRVLYDHGGFGACLVDIIWTTIPHAKSGLEPWDMHGMYGYRKLQTGEEGWELGYNDDEIANLLKRFPNFFEGMGPPQ
ncbi:hypothetical protein NA57DRAFT_57265 [Rhizodiscina lignyota]|uniref:Uncharacterized protein n=1 Tax=Rhizodiscina lignyota TaxID=1504668 RepID=A0A9P4IF23_9PEZI|nr:hypothetical protein NA57DRAFT_57265 [Rhizodiscina lignyota]